MRTVCADLPAWVLIIISNDMEHSDTIRAGIALADKINQTTDEQRTADKSTLVFRHSMCVGIDYDND